MKGTEMNQTTTTPPSDPEAERYVLGAVFADNRVMGDIATRLTPDHFTVFLHRLTFEAMVYTFKASESITPFNIGTALDKAGCLLDVGGAPELLELAESVMTVVDIEHYISRVENAFIYRQLQQIGLELHDDASNKRMVPHELLGKFGEKFIKLQSGINSKAVRHVKEILPEVMNEIHERAKGNQSRSYTFTGIIPLDQLMGPMRAKNLILCAARPGIGKTSLAMNIASNAASSGKRVLFLSLEMSDAELISRILSDWAQIDGRIIRDGDVRNSGILKKIIAASDSLHPIPLYIADCSGASMTDIISLCQQMQIKGGVDLVVLDYVGLLVGENRKQPRYEQVSEISRSLKALAKRLDCPLLALVQLNREAHGKPPTIANLRESGSLEQDADIVLLLHQLQANDGGHGNTELTVAKNRQGQTGKLNLLFRKEYTRFEAV